MNDTSAELCFSWKKFVTQTLLCVTKKSVRRNIKGGFLVLGAIVALLLLAVFMLNRYTKMFNDGMAAIEEYLSSAGFTVSRKIGNFRKTSGTCSYYLFVDDVKKQWCFVSPMNGAVNEIRRFDEFVTAIPFDVDSSNWISKLSEGIKPMKALYMKITIQAGLTVAGAGVGMSVGHLIGQFSWFEKEWMAVGAVAGGIGGNKLSTKLGNWAEDRIRNSPNPSTGGYGLIIKTVDSDKNDTAKIYDFLLMPGKGPPWMLERKGPIYKADMHVIQQMGDAFDHILANK